MQDNISYQKVSDQELDRVKRIKRSNESRE